jgi:acyl transferase domain-containing protein
VLGAGRDPAQPLLIGSVKANVGHLEAAAGVAGLIKLALVLQHGEIPAQLHLREPNPFIPWSELPVRAPTALTPWAAPTTSGRIGGISSFGFSGTNVHIILEQAPVPAAAPAQPPARPLQVLTVSARSDGARDELARRYAELLAAPGAALDDIAHAANAGRAHFAQRLAVVAADAADAAQKLRLHSAHQQAPGLITGAAALRAPRVAFVFTGQGSQYAGMARALYDTEPVFRAELDRCDALLRAGCGLPLLQVLYPAAGAASSLDDTAHTQPALFALEYALARLWMSWGVKPHAVLGHSLGEYVAACIAGVCSLEDALALVAERGRLMGALPAGGAMAAVMADEARVRAALAPWSRELSIAAVNGPLNTVVSGAAGAVDALLAALQRDGIEASRLKVSHAFHSPLVEPMLNAFEAKAASLRWQAPQLDLISNVSGERAGAEVAQPGYWRTHVRAPVQFARAMQTLARLGCDVVLEIGPHPTLLGLGRACIEGEQRRWLPSLRRGQPDADTLMSSLAALYVAGVVVDWRAVHAGRAHAPVSLPGYPFQRERFWVDRPKPTTVSAPPAVAALAASAAAVLERPPHALLGREVLHPFGEERLFETELHVSRQPWLADHRIQGSLVLPSPVCMAIAVAAFRIAFGDDPVTVEDLTVHRALPVDGEVPAIVQTVVAPAHGGSAALRLLSRENERDDDDASRPRATLLATAQLRRHAARDPLSPLALDEVRARTHESIAVTDYYTMLERLGLEFGPRFRGVQDIRRCHGEVLATMCLPASLRADEAGPAFHPALLDACFHVVGAALPGGGSALGEAFLLMNVQRMAVLAPLPERFLVHVRVDPADVSELAGREAFGADLHLYAEDGRPLLAFTGVTFKRARAGALRPMRLPERVQRMLHEVMWRPAPQSRSATPLQLAAAFEPALPEIAARNHFDRYAEFLPGLDRLAAAYVWQALRTLGAALAPGDVLHTGSRAALGVLERHQRLFERLLEIGAEDGWLRREGSAWQVLALADEPDPEALGAVLARNHPDATAELTLTQRCARELAAVMRGRADPLALLFPGGSLADTERLYRDSPTARAYNSLIAQVVERIVESQAAQPGAVPQPTLRVLEIGAGTGSTTAYLLPQLAAALGGRVLQYTFTDVSPLFLNRARERFAAQPGMHYQLLDIGMPPGGQAFEAGAFDIVIGANVLHATADLQVTLDHVRALLAPGGHLVLLEGVLPQRFGDLTVGLLEGWWAYTDTGRRRYALMSRASWLRLLGERGFAESAALPGETAHPVWKQQAIFVAQMPKVAAVPVAAKRAVERWLVQPDAGGVANALAAMLNARGDRVDSLDTTIVPAHALAKALADPTPVAGVLALAAVDLAADAALDSAALMDEQQRVLGGTLALSQALAARPQPLPLWIVTRGAQAVLTGEGANPAQATLWGLSHVIAIEHPELACRRVDLDAHADASSAAMALLAELDAAGAEDQIAVRDLPSIGQRFVRRLQRAPQRPPSRVPIEIRNDRTYLVTGGLHGLGLRVARWLVQRGARHVVLMGRRAPDAAASQEIAALRNSHAQVEVHQGDVADEGAMTSLLGRLRSAAEPLAGVVHAAGALDDGVLSGLTWSRFETVMAAKVRGSWNLHRHAGALDFMVFFSSGASVGGSAGQANHAAANAFEDALAWHRNAVGQPTLSVNWGPWAEIGTVADRGLRQPGALTPIAPADGLLAFEHLLRIDGERRFAPAQVAVLATDWAHLRTAREARSEPTLYRDLALPGRYDGARGASSGDADATASGASAHAGQSASAGGAGPERSWHERVAAAMPNRRRTVLRELVRSLAARVLGLARPEELAPEQPLRQLGLDSLMAVELRNLLGGAVGETLPATVTFDHPSVAALADHLAATVFVVELSQPGRTRSVDPAEVQAPVASAALDTMSEAELAAQLASRLDSLRTP